MKKLALLAAAGAVISTPAMAAPGNTDSATGAATAEVVAPIAITHDTGAALNFGKFTAGPNPGSVTVTSASVVTTTGDAIHVAGSTESADSFTVTGDPTRGFSLTATGGSVTNGTASMSFTTSIAAGGTLDASGTANVRVGGTLSVGVNQDPGVYDGDYEVTATYN